jgi:hypothetical protein
VEQREILVWVSGARRNTSVSEWSKAKYQCE